MDPRDQYGRVPPPQPFITETYVRDTAHPQRGVLLTIWLSLIGVGNVLALLLVLSYIGSLVGFLAVLVAAANLVAVYLLFSWKIAGFYILIGTLIAGITLTLLLGAGDIRSLNGAGSVAVLWWLIRKQWHDFD